MTSLRRATAAAGSVHNAATSQIDGRPDVIQRSYPLRPDAAQSVTPARDPAPDWSRLFQDLLAYFDGLGREQWVPERLAEAIRDRVRPKYLALLTDDQESPNRRLAWGHGFDLPAEAVASRSEDPLPWLARVTGVQAFARRSQAYVTPLHLGQQQAAALCMVSSRRGPALAGEQMFVAAAAAIFDRQQGVGASPHDAPAPSFISSAPGGRARSANGRTSAVLTARDLDQALLPKLARVVESAKEMVLITDAWGTIEYVNPAFERTTGFRWEEAVGQTPRILKSGAHPPSIYRELWETILSGSIWTGTLVNRRRDGRPFEAKVTIAPIRDDQDAVLGFVQVAEDVSQISQLERERTALTRASLAASGALSLPLAFQIILLAALSATDADGGCAVFVGRAKEEFGASVGVGMLVDAQHSQQTLETIEDAGMRQRERVLVQSARQIPGLHGLRSLAVLQINVKGELLGVIGLVARRADVFSESLRPFFESLVSHATMLVENMLLHQEVLRRIKVLDTLGQITRALRGAQTLDQLLNLLVEDVSRALGGTGAAILLLDASRTFLTVRASRGQLAGMTGSFPCDQSVLSLPLRLAHLTIADHADLEELGRLTGVDQRTVALIPLSVASGDVGILIVGRQQALPFSRADLGLMAVLGDVASTAVHRVKLREELEEAYVATTLALAEAVDARDSYVAGHAQRTGVLAEQAALAMKLPEDEIRDIRYGAILHDVGKISVPDNILVKIGPLSPEEWEVIRRHSVAGARILAPVARLTRAAEVVRHHHERWDGTGYPDGLKGEEIPLGARIVAVVDAYTAMIDERTYRKARSPEEAVEELRRHAGTQFDPAVVEAFLSVVQTRNFSV